MLSGTNFCMTSLRLAFVIAMIAAAQPAMSRTAPAAPAAERILDDSGGRIGAYLSRYQALRKSGQHVAIDGTCASACTLLLGVIPHDRICVTPRAVPSLTGAQFNAAGTKYLWSHYPGDVRRWIARHGGLRSQTLYLGGRELAAMFPTCR
jgi:hypothetical protein